MLTDIMEFIFLWQIILLVKFPILFELSIIFTIAAIAFIIGRKVAK